MPVVMTKNGPALRVGGRVLNLAKREGEAVLLVDKWCGQREGGPLFISDAVELVFMFRTILDALHIEVEEGGESRASFSVSPEIQRFMDTWGARFEDAEEDLAEDDCRGLPKNEEELAALAA
ncbi:hypothetical protein [Methylobacterium gnaphalii]|nr:hypothetical protein [Methylobacterium gnaphalii]